jgi:hypothetical protein
MSSKEIEEKKALRMGSFSTVYIGRVMQLLGNARALAKTDIARRVGDLPGGEGIAHDNDIQDVAGDDIIKEDAI